MNENSLKNLRQFNPGKILFTQRSEETDFYEILKDTLNFKITYNGIEGTVASHLVARILSDSIQGKVRMVAELSKIILANIPQKTEHSFDFVACFGEDNSSDELNNKPENNIDKE